MSRIVKSAVVRTLATHLRALVKDRAGNTMFIAVIALIPLTAMIGSALDLSVAWTARARLQHACDAGVLAARQAMDGNAWTTGAQTQGRKFFDFNFPPGTSGATGIAFTLAPNASDNAELVATADASIPTTLMKIFGFRQFGLHVSCNAKRDLGHNDVMLVLDVTGSMADAPSSGSGTKIGRLRTGAIGLYRALVDASGGITRFGIMPYSHTVNVARSLRTDDILRDQYYVRRTTQCNYRYCWYVYGSKTVNINASSWASGTSVTTNIDNFRTSGNGCIEERPSVGNSMLPFEIDDTVTADDVDRKAASGTDGNLQFGRYDSAVQEGMSQVGCPAEAAKLQTYDTEAAFQTAINNGTARVTGGTYHDVGMLWGLRFLSRTGFFSSENPTSRSGVPVRQHIVFMTDGMLDTGDTLYSGHGVERYQARTQGTGTMEERHISRFQTACSLAKAAGVTVWVIALDVGSTDDIEPCATGPAYFYVSDGSDLQQVFEAIGKGIGNLRLTR
jgi:Flp pilus assembly protein TadG